MRAWNEVSDDHHDEGIERQMQKLTVNERPVQNLTNGRHHDANGSSADGPGPDDSHRHDGRRGQGRVQRGGRQGRRGGRRGGGGGDNRYRSGESEFQYDASRRGQSRRISSDQLPMMRRGYKNTETFKPSHELPHMRILFAPSSWTSYGRPYSPLDVVVVNHLFQDQPGDKTYYQTLFDEIEAVYASSKDETEGQLWLSWHGDTHFIANDALTNNWQKRCPTYSAVVDKLAQFFAVDVKATRFNLYRDTSEWKPFHFDAAAVKPDKAKTQNITVAVSFGVERDAAFEHADTKTVVSLPQPDGCVYTFGQAVNCTWRHGIPQVRREKFVAEGRISIILWGWMEQTKLEDC